MSKIKLLYDAVTAIKEKDSCSGNLKVEGNRDGVKIFGLDNEFEKNMGDGRTRAKISLEIDCEGKKVKHESSTEFACPGSHDDRRHDFWRHMAFRHGHGHGHYPKHDHMAGWGGKHGGIKEKLNKLAFLLNVLNNLKVEEREDKSTVLSLDFNEIPGELKKSIHEKFQRHQMSGAHGHQCLLKEFAGMDVTTALLHIFLNKNKEVEKILLAVTGKQKNDLNQPHQLDLQAELRLAW